MTRINIIQKKKEGKKTANWKKEKNEQTTKRPTERTNERMKGKNEGTNERTHERTNERNPNVFCIPCVCMLFRYTSMAMQQFIRAYSMRVCVYSYKIRKNIRSLWPNYKTLYAVFNSIQSIFGLFAADIVYYV